MAHDIGPSSTRLAPMDLGTILDQTARIYVGNFPVLVGASLLFHLPLLAILSQMSFASPLRHVVVLFGSLVALLVTSVSTRVVADRFHGVKRGIGAYMALALSDFTRTFGTFFLVGLWVVLGLILLVVPGIFWSFTLMLAMPVALLEGVVGSDALVRSKVLIKNNRGKAVGAYVLALILYFGFTVMLGAGWGIAAATLFPGSSLLIVLGGEIIGYAVTPLMPIVIALIYFDFRVRYEGYDLEMLDKAAG